MGERRKISTRRRMNMGLRNSPEVSVRKESLLTAVDSKRYMTTMCLRGHRLVEEFYDDLERICTEAIELTPNDCSEKSHRVSGIH